MAYTIDEFANIDVAKLHKGENFECINCGRKLHEANVKCGECDFDAFLDSHPVGLPIAQRQ